MEFDRTGIILYTINYETCVKFYKDVLELEIMFSTEMLTCFKLGGLYLMVELDDSLIPGKKYKLPERIKTCIRMNVAHVKDYADKLMTHNIEVDYQEHSWGTIAKFFDPDGNLCAFRDSKTFEKQVNDF